MIRPVAERDRSFWQTAKITRAPVALIYINGNRRSGALG